MRRTQGYLLRQRSQYQSSDIGNHMHGIRQQGKRTGSPGPNGFDDGKQRGQKKSRVQR